MTDKLLRTEDGDHYVKDIELLDEESLKNLNEQTIRVLKKISVERGYPKMIADELGIHEQKVYYHVRKLEEAGLIEVYKREKVGGALCKFYRPTSEAFGFSLNDEWKKVRMNKAGLSGKVLDFFSEFVGEGVFQGSIVVGSPKEHGPFMTSARDGHYAVQLGIFLGSFCDLEKRFVVKLDTEVKAEGATDRHLMMIGGPITNMISRDLNEDLDVRFDWEQKTWEIVSKRTGSRYSGENLGLIAKVHKDGLARILFSGLDFKGTKTCILGITQEHEEILKDYEVDDEFYRVIKGLDRDGDGKTDDIEVLE